MTKRLVSRLDQQAIGLRLTPAAIDLIAKEGYQPAYGARPIRRAIQTLIEDPLSMQLLDHEVKPGEKITVGARKGKLTFTTQRKK